MHTSYFLAQNVSAFARGVSRRYAQKLHDRTDRRNQEQLMSTSGKYFSNDLY